MPGPARLLEVVEATWPAASRTRIGPWTIRDGQGGGKRASAATADDPVAARDIPVAERAMADLGQRPLFMIRAGDEPLDDLLSRADYELLDPVDIFAIPLADLELPAPHRLGAIPSWPPLAIQREIWAAGGIGPARIAVMERACSPKITFLSRRDDRPAGTAFAAIHDGVAMVHALEVLPEYRRRGVARALMAGARKWALHEGAADLALVVAKANTGAQGLYSSLGMARVGQYHYRMKTKESQS